MRSDVRLHCQRLCVNPDNLLTLEAVVAPASSHYCGSLVPAGEVHQYHPLIRNLQVHFVDSSKQHSDCIFEGLNWKRVGIHQSSDINCGAGFELCQISMQADGFYLTMMC